MTHRGVDFSFLQICQQAISLLFGTGKYQHLEPVLFGQQLFKQLDFPAFFNRIHDVLNGIGSAVGFGHPDLLVVFQDLMR